jgi:hypothetical protein
MSGWFVGSQIGVPVESVRSIEFCLPVLGMKEADSPAHSQASDVGSSSIVRSRSLDDPIPFTRLPAAASNKFSLRALARSRGLRYSIRMRKLQRKLRVAEFVSKCEDQVAINAVIELRSLEYPGSGKWHEFGK